MFKSNTLISILQTYQLCTVVHGAYHLCMYVMCFAHADAAIQFNIVYYSVYARNT